MYDDLKRLAIALGDSVHSSKRGMARNGADNQRWKEELKDQCLHGIRTGLESHLPRDVAIRFVETPYNTSGVRTSVAGRGAGRNELRTAMWTRDVPTRTITVLADILDGTWNAACGLPWSSSTMVAFTEIVTEPLPVEELTLADFKCGLVVPVVGGITVPEELPGFYYGVVGERPCYRSWHSTLEVPLHATDIDDVRLTRFFLDLFTDESYEALAISIDAVKPLIYEWADIARFYGAGIELMSLLAPPGIQPGFGGYVSANQKADNLIPTTMLLEGAGVRVTNWWGESIAGMRIVDRMYVAIAATKPLHDRMLAHLSTTERLPRSRDAAPLVTEGARG